MEHNSHLDRAFRSAEFHNPPQVAIGESSSSNLDEDEFDCYGFRKALSDYKSNPALLVDMTGKNDDKIHSFIQQVNHPQAMELMQPFDVFKRYDNEVEPGIWIQATKFNFTRAWMKRCDWDNCGGPDDPEVWVKEKQYMVNYWTHKTIKFLKFRKYSIPDKPLAVYLVFEELTDLGAPNKKAKFTHQSSSNQINYQTQTSSHSSPVTSNSSYFSPNSNGTFMDVNKEQNGFEAVHNAAQDLCSSQSNENNTNNGYYYSDQSTEYQQHQDTSQIEINLHSQVLENTERSKRNEKEIEALKEQQRQLAQQHVALDIKTNSNTREIEELTDSVAKLEIANQNMIIKAIITLLRNNNGTFVASSKLASKVRESLEDESITTMAVNRILTTILEKRGVITRSSDRTTWILNEQAAKKFDL